MARRSSYHFSCGNSKVGSIGFCARVQATSRREAVEILRHHLPDSVTVELSWGDVTESEAGRVEYVEVYLNADAVGVGDIDEVDDIDGFEGR